MPRTAIAWFRRDLRVHDHPALSAALDEADRILPVFVLDDRLLGGRFASPPRAWFLRRSLEELRAALRERGGDLVIRRGAPEDVLPQLARQVGAASVHHALEVSPFGVARDERVRSALAADGVAVHCHPGAFVVEDVAAVRTQAGGSFSVFSPFWRAWRELPRRDVLGAPDRIALAHGVDPHGIPDALPRDPGLVEPLEPGEAAARARVEEFLAGELTAYADRHDRLAGGTSRLSPHLHFGTLSARELEAAARRHRGAGRDAFVRQLAWRDFYAHVLLHHPGNARHAFRAEMDALEWDDDDVAFAAWAEGRTGYPVVDAGMRELRVRGWMHNRARLICASFLVKDLHIDWRRGEAHFMRWLLCGDEASNNGNWQWVSSIGVDPAPFERRLYNPVRQQRRHDPDGEYVRRWVPELQRVPLERIAEPWKMPPAEQEAYGCVLGRDYPEPIVDHAQERRRAIARYRAIREVPGASARRLG
jgi:deoxyribodipyrimidine photo-lyase